MSYGTKRSFLLYSNNKYESGKFNLLIDDFKLSFKNNDIKSKFIEEIGIDIIEDIKDVNDFIESNLNKDNEFLLVSKTKTLYIDKKEIKLPHTIDIFLILDYLVENEKFYIQKDKEKIDYIEYLYCKPQYQGAIYSRWSVDGNVILKITHGFVD